MSNKDLSRYEDFKKILDKRQTGVQAAESLGLSSRQAKRLLKRLKIEGPKGLISKKIGSPGNHHLPPGLKEIALIQQHYTERD